MALGGAFLKVSSTLLRAIEFLASITVLGIFAYFLVYLQQHNLTILTFVRAVTGISGAAALYALVAFFLTCCLGGVTVFAFVGIVLDIAFAAAWIAVAVLTKDGTENCGALGRGGGTSDIYADPSKVVTVDTDTAQRICNLYKAAFVLAIINLILFLVTAVLQFAIGKSHQRDKRRGVESRGPRFPFMNRRHKASQREMEQGAVPVA